MGRDRRVRWLATAAGVGMFLVIVMGAAVTNTGSSQGCGPSWPLCRGQFIPEFAFTTAVEFSHRAVTGAVGLLVVTLGLVAWLRYRERPDVRALVLLMVGSLLLQSGLGALAVLAPQTPAVLALHFGISLISFASVWLLRDFLAVGAGKTGLPDQAVPTAFRRVSWATIVYVYLVVYIGAYVRHTGVSLACDGWPLCNGMLWPGLAGPAGVVFVHRVAALGTLVLLGVLAGLGVRLRHSRPELARGALLALCLALAQALSGALIVATLLSLASALLHAALIAALFATLAVLCRQALRRYGAETASGEVPQTSAPRSPSGTERGVPRRPDTAY